MDQRRPHRKGGGSGEGRIREEAAAICLYIQCSMCEKPVGRYEAHKLSCKNERDDDILSAEVRGDYKCQDRTTLKKEFSVGKVTFSSVSLKLGARWGGTSVYIL